MAAALQGCQHHAFTSRNTSYGPPPRCRHTRSPVQHPPSARTVSSRASVSSSLVSVLRDELKVARENYRKDEQLIDDPPCDYELENPSGQTAFYLKKQHQGEDIIIEVDLDAQPMPDEDEDDDEPDRGHRGSTDEGVLDVELPIHFKVQIAKSNKALLFDCESDGEYVTINKLAMAEVPDESKDEDGDGDEDEDGIMRQPYSGPAFEELDDTLQQAFLDYLEERGVNAELGEYMRLFARHKADLEYQAWLERVRDFVAG
ncbi:hypothetical protein QJQ45_022453 [Haematococcus lacustris]|nr:hypothetical protein QJQ45_022453 [Haematococcus lacustris]